MFDPRDLEEGEEYKLQFKNTGTVRTVEQTVVVDERDDEAGEVTLEADDGAIYRIPFDEKLLYVGPSQVGHNLRMCEVN